MFQVAAERFGVVDRDVPSNSHIENTRNKNESITYIIYDQNAMYNALQDKRRSFSGCQSLDKPCEYSFQGMHNSRLRLDNG